MEEKELQVQKQVSQETETNTQTINTEENQSVETVSVPQIEQFRKSEMEFKTKRELQGVTEVNEALQTEAKEFTKKQDKVKQNVGVRAKVIKGVYFSVLSMLLVLVGANAITLALLANTSNKNTETIQAKQDEVAEYVLSGEEIPDALPITLNEPRDYNDDNKELTFWDKVTILFRNIFS